MAPLGAAGPHSTGTGMCLASNSAAPPHSYYSAPLVHPPSLPAKRDNLQSHQSMCIWLWKLCTFFNGHAGLAHLCCVEWPRQQAAEPGLDKGEPVGWVRQVEGGGETVPLIPDTHKAEVRPWLSHGILHGPQGLRACTSYLCGGHAALAKMAKQLPAWCICIFDNCINDGCETR